MKLILCAAFAVICGTAGAAVNKCVDQEGHVLFTDADCPQSAQPGLATAPSDSAAPSSDVLAAVSAEPSAPPVLPSVVAPAPRSRWAALPPSTVRSSASVDTLTLRTAHQTMQMQDELHKSRRLVSSR
ncbi:hypothetical protein [Duganella sp. BuS-21]|uniref:hypothetical protein n=1 Tax=Duganella sp. BuS-21 TaxID=2943848 RepID=UPI0035A72B8D